jgi:RsiW-degrading membrane proteinase PrsW (M82 family)
VVRRPRGVQRARVLVGTKFLLIAGLVGFVVVAWLAELVAGLHHAVDLGPLLAALMAGIPAVLWLGFFYLLDRHEPEPKHLVVGVCVLGALIAAPLADFVQFQVVPPIALPVHGISPWSADRIIYAVFVAGLAQEMCKYAVVRYTIYQSRAFEEPMDGVIYMMACGTGFAIWANYHRLSGQGNQVFLSTGAA